MRGLSLFWSYLVQTLKTQMAYRWDFFVQCLSALTADATGLIVVAFIFQHTSSLGAWSAWEVLFIYAMAMIVQSIFGLTAYTFWHFPNKYIMEGQLDRILVRPVNPLIQLFMENIFVEELPSILTGLILLALAGYKLELHPGPGDVLLCLLFILSASIMLTGIFLGLTSASFWFEDRVGFAPPVFNFMAFGRYPMTIFHRSVQVLMSTLLPFAFMSFYPSMIFLRDNPAASEFQVLAWMTPLVGLTAFVVGYGLWLLGLKSYRSTGS